MKYATPAILDKLELLLELCPPAQLRQNITFVFFQYLVQMPQEALPPNQKEITEDLYFLIDFLQKIEKAIDEA